MNYRLSNALVQNHVLDCSIYMYDCLVISKQQPSHIIPVTLVPHHIILFGIIFHGIICRKPKGNLHRLK